MVFIPYGDPIEIAKVLDYKRLGKQRVEARQILAIITGEAKWTAWRNHPAVIMWRDFPDALKYYYNIMIREWIARGYVNHMTEYKLDQVPEMPWFMSCNPVLLSHRATLLRKDYSHYIRYFTAPRTYMTRNVLWPIIAEKYLTEKQILALQSGKKINIVDYTQIYTPVATLSR